MQYTIRNVPDLLDEALRRSAREQGKSLNRVAIEALARGAGLMEQFRRRDLSDIAGTWKKIRPSRVRSQRRTRLMRSCGDDHSARQNRSTQPTLMKLALDTNRYTDLCRGDSSVVETVELADEVWLPFVIIRAEQVPKAQMKVARHEA